MEEFVQVRDTCRRGCKVIYTDPNGKQTTIKTIEGVTRRSRGLAGVREK